MKTAIFGGGCFWCLEAVFKRLRGVERVIPGYCGGHLDEPDYESVCLGESGHAEVVEILYDSTIISWPTLLEVFFAIHDPTSLDRQGADVGTQYRSVVFVHDAQEEVAVREAIEAAALAWEGPVVTEIRKVAPFFPAEFYHLDYYDRNPEQGYCAYVIAPKLQKLRQGFAALMKPARI